MEVFSRFMVRAIGDSSGAHLATFFSTSLLLANDILQRNATHQRSASRTNPDWDSISTIPMRLSTILFGYECILFGIIDLSRQSL